MRWFTSAGRQMRQGAALRAISLILTLALATIAPLGCDEDPGQVLLTPPGGRGTIAGVLAFQGATSPPLPQADILAVASSSEGTGCSSAFGGISVLGTLNGFDAARAAEFGMTELLPCLWILSVELEAGPLDLKFVTGNSPGVVSFDSPPDYGNLGPNTNSDPLEGEADAGANGPDGNLSVTIPEAGTWNFILNEATIPATYRITQESLGIKSDARDGSFAIEDVLAGTYDLSIEADGFLPVRRTVSVKAFEVANLDTVSMEVATGGLRGRVEFSDNPSPLPTATVTVRRAGSAGVVQSIDTTRDFVILGLATGEYDLRVNAPGYLETRLNGIQYTNGVDTDAGTLTLTPGCVSTTNSIQIVGQFTTPPFDLAVSPFMTQDTPCVWRDTVTVVTPGTYLFKFVTDGAFDNPMDYGGSESETLTLPGTHPVELVSGQGTALSASILTAGEYIFTLDEGKLEFTATLIGGAGANGSIIGTIKFAGLNEGPYQAGYVKLFREGETNPILTRFSDRETRAFSITGLPEGTYEAEIGGVCYQPVTRTGIVIADNQRDLGQIELQEGTSSFTKIQLAGDFNGFDLEVAPSLDQSDCIWFVTTTLEAGTSFIKFVTEGAFDSPNDYGGDNATSYSLSAPVPISQVSGPDTAIKIEVPTTGSWILVLDERRQSVQATFSGASIEQGEN